MAIYYAVKYNIKIILRVETNLKFQINPFKKFCKFIILKKLFKKNFVFLSIGKLNKKFLIYHGVKKKKYYLHLIL